MAVTITNEITLDTVQPLLVIPWETRQTMGNIVRGVVGDGEPYITLEPAQRRSGQLELLFDTEADAEAARGVLAQLGAFTLDYPERTSIEMRFIVTGDLSVQLNAETSQHWLVGFDFQEVAP